MSSTATSMYVPLPQAFLGYSYTDIIDMQKVPNGVDCGGQVLDSAWISDAGLSALNSLNENFYPGNYPHDFNVDPAGYYTEIEAQCAESPRKHEEPIIVDGGRWYDLASSSMCSRRRLSPSDLTATYVDPNADPGLYRLVSGFYAADTSDPCTAYLTYCGVVYHDEEDTNHLAPCTVIR